MAQATRSKEAQQKQMGRDLIGIEYENLFTALRIGLTGVSDFFPSFDALNAFVEQQQDTSNRLKICRWVLSHQANYTAQQMQGAIGREFIAVNDRLAGAYLQMNDYESAKKYYEKGLLLVQ